MPWVIRITLLALAVSQSTTTNAGLLNPVEQSVWAPETAQAVDPHLLIALTESETLLLAESNHLAGDLRPMLVRFDANLDELWSIHLGDSRFRSSLVAATQLNNGDLLLAAIAQQTILVQVRSLISGTLLWDHAVVHTTEAGFDPPAIVQDPASGDVLVAAMGSGVLQVHHFGLDGSRVAKQLIDDSGLDHSPSDMVSLANNTIALVTRTGSTGKGDYRTFILDSTSDVVGMDTEAGSSGGILTGAWLHPDPVGGVRVLAGPESLCGLFESWLWRLDADAQRIWTQVVPDTNPCQSAMPIGMAPAPDQGLYIGSHRFDDASMHRVDADGKRLWTSDGKGMTEGTLFPHAIAAIATHQVMIVGSETIPGSGGLQRPSAVIWTSDGKSCMGGHLTAFGSVRHLVADDQGRWLAALQVPDEKMRLVVNLRRYDVPAPCIESPPDADDLFADDFEAML